MLRPLDDADGVLGDGLQVHRPVDDGVGNPEPDISKRVEEVLKWNGF